MKVLHVTGELYPLIKTGGLADVSRSLPDALSAHGADVRILLPAYREALQYVKQFNVVARCNVHIAGRARCVRLLEIQPDGFKTPVWLADCADLFDRPGNPYIGADGLDWPDNAERYACFSQLAAHIGAGQTGIEWQPDVVHSHDWQTGLVAAFLSQQAKAPRTVFTIHNLSYSGHFSHDEYQRLQLPMQWWQQDGVEFYGGFSMLKAALVYSDAITTVSPTYAKEILTPAFGCGMEGVLTHFGDKLSGILNGLDKDVWNPSSDPLIESNYSIKTRRSGKARNKRALLQALDVDDVEAWLQRPLFGFIGRLVEQKGIDLLADAIERLLQTSDDNAGFIIVGEGQQHLETQLQKLQARYPRHVKLFIGYAEALAHLVESGADFFVMPSRFEPCGLNQLYSLRYGTPPIVHHVGGLADTVVDATAANMRGKSATGLVFYEPTAAALCDALSRAMQLYQRPQKLAQIQRTAMQQDFDWRHSAKQYLSIYH